MSCARRIKGSITGFYISSAARILLSSPHGLSKKAEVPAIEIDGAIERKNKYEGNPKVHGVKR